ncbi:MAG: ketoacyl-ACP synthase III [Prevotellaceae bacterium]|jgi:3-oxoacyl-[acyl-carrier-protein] synthase-3|nr:ketoacyl-ACP synthase III [Prevotellaceae bacterium]
MYINATGYYVPEGRVHNDYFLNVNGLTGEWIEQRTGIVTRSKAGADENINTMSMKALQNALDSLPYSVRDVDLIISASYSPYDTVATAAHHAQRVYQIERAKAFYISSACSSFVNALEIAEGYFAMNKASRAMILSADKNTAYGNVSDPQAGHLWGDAAAVFFVSGEKICETDREILDIHTEGLGHVGKGTDAVMMRPRDGGIMMPGGRDVFAQACIHMQKNVLLLLERNGYTLEQLSWFICHQANMRILNNIAKQLLLPKKCFLHNIEKYGNTGSVSSALVYAQNEPKFSRGDLIAISVFGGGYSAGACLIKG